jgi:hypothetical protein
MTNLPASRHPRFQFHLRALLLLVTLLAVACGYVARQAEIVRDRRSIFNFSELSDGPQPIVGPANHYICFSLERRGVPWIRQLLGDRAVFEIGLPIGTDKAERQRVAALFPEATIRAFRPPYFMTRSDFGGQLFPFPDDEPTSTSATH